MNANILRTYTKANYVYYVSYREIMFVIRTIYENNAIRND